MAAPVNSPSSKSSTGPWLLLAGIAVLGTMAISKMLADRFDTGDEYPEYSTMRTDPLGTRAILEAIDLLPGVEAVRNFDSLHKLARDQSGSLLSNASAIAHKPADVHGQALVLCGLTAAELQSPDDRTKHLERFVRGGGRLIIALDPSGVSGRMERNIERALDELDHEDEEDGKAKKDEPAPEEKKAPPTKSEPKDQPDTKPKRDRFTGRHYDALSRVLQISAVSVAFDLTAKGGSELSLKPSLPLKQDEVPTWFSNTYLNDDPKQDWTPAWSRRIEERRKKNEAKKGPKTEPEKPKTEKTIVTSEPSRWQILASKGVRPMIMQRSLGAGTVIVCTDRYFLSNEALWKDPKPKFITWLLGDATKVIFDETHLGAMIGDEDGVMTLARRYRMHGLFLGGIILFALYIWRNAFSLVPSTAEDDLGYWRSDAVAGQSTASGLEGLLRRGVKFGDLLPRCFAVWSGTRAAAGTVPPQRQAQAKAVLDEPGALKTPVTTYRRLRDVLHPSKKL